MDLPAHLRVIATKGVLISDTRLASVGDAQVLVAHFRHQHRQHLLDGKRTMKVGMIIISLDDFEQIPEPFDERIELGGEVGKLP